MTRGFVRRLLAGLGVMAAGVLLLVFVYRPEMLPGVRMLLAGVFAACVFGGLFGILSGFYTSTFLCCPLWVTWIQHKQKKALLAKEAAKAQPKKK